MKHVILPYRKKTMPKLALFLLACFLLTTLGSLPQLQAASLLQSYQVLKDQYPEYVERLLDQGASEAQIEDFLRDLEQEIDLRGPLTRENFDALLLESMREVITWRKHRAVFNALLDSYGPEVEYTLDTGKLHPDLEPLRAALLKTLLGINIPRGSSGSSRNPLPDPLPPEPPPVEEPEEISDPGPLFPDTSEHWARDHIEELALRGAIKGYPDGSFRPEQTITRAEFAAVLHRDRDLPLLQGPLFADTEGHWAWELIASAYTYGILQGYSSTRFGPDDPITREQMARMIWQANITGAEDLPHYEMPFADAADIAPWAREAVAHAKTAGIISGYPDGSFRPQAHSTRAEAVTMIARSR